jgi:hypothetical protein
VFGQTFQYVPEGSGLAGGEMVERELANAPNVVRPCTAKGGHASLGQDGQCAAPVTGLRATTFHETFD